jgi:DNA invertase Pin-like site-specific DNA recombinase
MWQMIGVLAELERSLIAELTKAGVAAAKKRGVKFGRKRKRNPHQIDQAGRLLGKRKPPSRDEVSALFNINRSTLYRALALP